MRKQCILNISTGCTDSSQQAEFHKGRDYDIDSHAFRSIFNEQNEHRLSVFIQTCSPVLVRASEKQQEIGEMSAVICVGNLDPDKG